MIGSREGQPANQREEIWLSWKQKSCMSLLSVCSGINACDENNVVIVSVQTPCSEKSIHFSSSATQSSIVFSLILDNFGDRILFMA